MSTQAIFSEIMKLPPAERRDLVWDLVDAISEEGGSPDLSPEFVAELDRRYQECVDHPEKCIPLDQVMNDLRSEFKL